MTYEFDSDYVRNTLTPAVNSAVLGTELGGDTTKISEFSKAGPTSSYSFGLYQFDVDKNSAARSFLSLIGFSDTQITQLRQTTPISVELRNSLNSQLHTALNDPANAVKLQLFTDAWAAGLVNQLQNVLNNLAGSGSVGQAIASQINSSTALQVQLIDYGNQFHLDLNGRMTNWLQGNSVTMPGGTFHLAPGAVLTKDMIRSFVMATDYGVSHSNAETHRENALFNVINTIPAGLPPAIDDTSESPVLDDTFIPKVIITPTSCTQVGDTQLTDADRAALIKSCAQAAAGSATPEGSTDGTAAGVGTSDGGNLSTAGDNGGNSGGGTDSGSGSGGGDSGSEGGGDGDSGGGDSGGGGDGGGGGGGGGGDGGGDGDGGGGGGDGDDHPPHDAHRIGTAVHSDTVKLNSTGAFAGDALMKPSSASVSALSTHATLQASGLRSASQLIQSMASFGVQSSALSHEHGFAVGISPAEMALAVTRHPGRMAA